jgi:Leucine-rich repeat (LRR) protein
MQDMIIWESTDVALTPSSISNICGLSNLTTLNLRNVPFTCIPEELGNLKNLKDLDLTETGLRDLYPYEELRKKIKALLPKCSRIAL